MSPMLPQSDYTTYLLEQYQQIQANCSTSLPVTTYSNTLLVSTATAAVTTASTAPTATNSKCLGQSIPATSTHLGCNALSDKYNVTTGDLKSITGDDLCQFNGSICAPLPCPLDTVYFFPNW